MQTEYDLTTIQLDNNLKQLSTLNGGNPVVFNDSIYEPIPDNINLDSVKNKFINEDPQLKIYELNKQIAQTQKKISTARSMHAFEVGYTSEFAESENYHGFILGMSIPLWENKNTVKYAKINIIATDADCENYIFTKTREIEQIFAEYQKERQLYNLSASLINEIESERLLQMALEEGEISGLEYFSEISFFYQAIDNLLLIERELNLTYCRLMKYSLVGLIVY